MKLKLMALLVAMLAIVCMFASCKKNTGDGGEDNAPNGIYPWNKTDLLVQLYENSNNDELSPQLKRYCAGQDTAGTGEIDNLVRKRNDAAYAHANVKVKYNYEVSFGWGAAITDIVTNGKSGSEKAPDIFANFAYDMTAAALRGAFANLNANTDKISTKYGNGENYFEFNKDGYVGINPDSYFDSNAGQGYFYDYMQSLAFVNENGEYDKMYCLASNYCVDAVRAFLVVPVNVEMLEGITYDAVKDYDANGDKNFDVEDFYTLVWEYGWTYDALARFSKAVFRNDNTANPDADIKDTLGFCAGKSSGLTASGIVYTTSVKIINKVQKEGKWTYEYPAKNDDLIALSNALYDLFKNNTGVCTLDSADAKQLFTGVKGDLDGIRNRFAENKVLFGGVIAVGSLEDAVYQTLNAPGKQGFGVVPVPLYKQTKVLDAEGKFDKSADDFQDYQTLVHNLARIFAISATTQKFEQCSAFLNYQSTNSSEILEMYYKQNLVAAVNAGDAAKHNVKMLNYIRAHVRDCFDKTYEDVISDYQKVTDAQSSSKRWHGIFYSNGYMVQNMQQRYDEESPAKQEQLITVLGEWAKLK